MKTFSPVLAAAVGGAFPGLLHLAVLCLKSPDQLPTGMDLAAFLVGVLLFAVLGGIVGFIWGEVNLQKAFYIGVGLPALLNASIANVTSLKSEEHNTDSPPSHAWRFPSLVTSAMAQDTNEALRSRGSSGVATNGRIMRLLAQGDVAAIPLSDATNRVLVIPPNPRLSQVEVTVFAGDGKRLDRFSVDSRKTNRIVLRNSAKSISIGGNDFSPVQQELTSNPTTLLELKAQRRMWSGFERAVGVQSVKNFDLDVQQKAVARE